jgi:ankyrin repeat protein
MNKSGDKPEVLPDSEVKNFRSVEMKESSRVAIGEVGFESIVDGEGDGLNIKYVKSSESHIEVPVEGSEIKLVNPFLEKSTSRGTTRIDSTSKSLSTIKVNNPAPLPDFTQDVSATQVSSVVQHTSEDVERLQLVIADLSRRLLNAQHTIEAQREVAKKSAALAERFRRELGEAHNRLRLETAKNISSARKKVHAEEAARFERNKIKATKMHEAVRNAILDRTSQGMRTTSNKIEKIKSDITVLEAQHESQKRLLLHLGEMDKMTEDLANAAQHGDLQECAALIKRGARINELDTAGYLPLYYAASFGHVACAKLLLEFGTDPSSYLSGHSAIEIAARNGHTACVKVLIRFGADLEDAGLRGVTALNSAVANGHMECALVLLDAGADIQGRNMNEDSPLHVATLLPNPVPMIRLLIKKGADVHVVNRQGYSPVRMAIANACALAVDALGGRAAMAPMDDALLFNGSEHGEDGKKGKTLRLFAIYFIYVSNLCSAHSCYCLFSSRII